MGGKAQPQVYPAAQPYADVHGLASMTRSEKVTLYSFSFPSLFSCLTLRLFCSHRFRVRARNAAGWSCYSSEKSAPTPETVHQQQIRAMKMQKLREWQATRQWCRKGVVVRHIVHAWNGSYHLAVVKSDPYLRDTDYQRKAVPDDTVLHTMFSSPTSDLFSPKVEIEYACGTEKTATASKDYLQKATAAQEENYKRSLCSRRRCPHNCPEPLCVQRRKYRYVCNC